MTKPLKYHAAGKTNYRHLCGKGGMVGGRHPNYPVTCDRCLKLIAKSKEIK